VDVMLSFILLMLLSFNSFFSLFSLLTHSVRSTSSFVHSHTHTLSFILCFTFWWMTSLYEQEIFSLKYFYIQYGCVYLRVSLCVYACGSSDVEE
jgi:hypothetical protein